MELIGLVPLIGKLTHVIVFILNRVATWTGTLFLYRKGKRTGKKYYYVLAVMIYVTSWALVILGSEKIWKWISTKIH